MHLDWGTTLVLAVAIAAIAALWLTLAVICIFRARECGTDRQALAALYIGLASCALLLTVVNGVEAVGLFSFNPQGTTAALLQLPLNVGIAAFFFHRLKTTKSKTEAEDDFIDQTITALQTSVDQRAAETAEATARLQMVSDENAGLLERLYSERAVLESVLHANTGMVCIVDTEGVIKFVNGESFAVMGLAGDEAIGTSLHALDWRQPDVTGMPLQISEMPYYRVMQADAPVHGIECAMELPNGSRRILEINGAPLRHAGNDISGVLLLISDVSLRKETSEQLQTSERRFRMMIEGLPGGAVYIESDRLFMNRAAESITGYTRDELTTVSQWFWALYGKESAAIKAHYEKALTAGASTSATRTISRKDGEQRIIQFDIHKIKQTEIWLIHDVTERFRIEGALRASEEKYRTLAETARDMICVHDLEGRLTYCNAAMNRFAQQMTGCESDVRTCDFLTPESKDRINAQLDRRLAGDRSRFLFEIEAAAQDGTTVPLEVSAAPIETNGVISGCLSIMRDISERKASEASRRRFEAQLYQTQKLESLAVLSSGIANDFNNALTGILGNAELLRAAVDAPELADIAANAKRAADLCKMLLAFAGQATVSSDLYNLSEIVQDAVRFARPAIPRGIEINLKLDDATPEVAVDSAELHQLLRALLTNAAESIGDRNGTIAVRSGILDGPNSPQSSTGDILDHGDYVFLSVADSGCGMKSDVAMRMFDPFFTTKSRGSGLGLARALGVARAHGGTIHVVTQPGAGTTVTAYIALRAPALPRTLPAMNENALWHGEGTILVVDDEENVRTVTKRMLQRLGFDVVLASDGREAIAQVASTAKELTAVILDLTMPNMDGDSAYAEIRRIKPKLPVLIASGYDVKTVTNRFDRANVSSFIQKPFQIRDLSEHLKEALHADKQA